MTNNMDDNDFGQISNILKTRKLVKAPAYEWQDFALRVIKELGAPPFKRSAIFKICNDLPRPLVEQALNDTKELCKGGQAWMYFFKIIESIGKNNPPAKN